MKFTSKDLDDDDREDIVERLDVDPDLPEFDCERADDDLIITWTKGVPAGHEAQDGHGGEPTDVFRDFFLDGDDRFIG